MIPRFPCGALCAVLIGVSSWAQAADEAALREYVRKAVGDPKVFVYNPPAELRAYANLSPADIEKKMSAAGQDGSILILFPNGLPMKLSSNKNYKANGEARTWYADGAAQSEETYADEKLLQGKYYAADGKLMAEVRDGRGKQIEFDLKQDGRTSVPQRETEYVDGLKDGKETTFASWGDGRISSETPYRKGMKNGVRKFWMPSGQLNVEETYVDNLQQGVTTCWHANGMVQSLAQYDKGKQVGTSSRYAENGQKIEETIRDGEYSLLEMQWYPEGAMMVCKKYDPATHRLIEAQSFDRTGAVNGTVKEQQGNLVVIEDPSGRTGDRESFTLEQYNGENYATRARLPALQWNSAGQQKDALQIAFRAEKSPGFDELTARIEPLVSGGEPINLQWKSSDEKTVPTTIPVPTGTAPWSGALYAHVTAAGKAGTHSFTQIVYSKEPERERKPERPRKEEGPKPMYISQYGPPMKVTADGKPYPDLNAALGGWTSKTGQWLLYTEPAALLFRPAVDKPWTLQREFPDRPEGLLMLGENHLVVWSTKSTDTPEKGIPHVVEASLDGGKTWSTASIPDMDYVVTMNVLNGHWMIAGVRLPKDGLPTGKDWFELRQTIFLSSDSGKHFTELAGPSFFPTGEPYQKSIAPDGRRRVYLRDEGFQDPFTQIYFTASPDAVPRPVLSCTYKPEIVWSTNSQILALSHGGKFIAYYDTATGKSESLPPSMRNQELADKEIAARGEMDRKIRGIVEGAN